MITKENFETEVLDEKKGTFFWHYAGQGFHITIKFFGAKEACVDLYVGSLTDLEESEPITFPKDATEEQRWQALLVVANKLKETHESSK